MSDVSFDQPVHQDLPRELSEDELLAAEELKSADFYNFVIEQVEELDDETCRQVLNSWRALHGRRIADTAFEMRSEK